MLYALRLCCCMAAPALGLLGCSMPPLPENSPLNFPRASTFDIVRKVRCEVKAGLDRFKHTEHIKQIIRATSIGYDFKFILAETDGAAGGDLTFVDRPAKKSNKGSTTFDLTGSATKSRQNIRTFRIVEQLSDVEAAECSPETLRAELAYPIAGSLRADDVVSSYIRLERMTDLGEAGEPVAVDDPAKKTKVFSDYLLFNTKMNLQATPTLTVSAVAGSFRLTNATVQGSATRSDQHSLIIAFAQDPDFHTNELKRAARNRVNLVAERRLPNAPAASLAKSAISGPRMQTTLVAANADARNQVLLELARVRNLADDEQESSKFLGQRLLTFLRPPGETGPGERP